MQDHQGSPSSIKEFGAAFLSSLQEAAAQSAAQPASVVQSLRGHFGTDLKALPIVTESFDAHDHPNVHVALETFLAEQGRSADLLGVSSDAHWMEITFSQLIAGTSPGSPMAVADGRERNIYRSRTLQLGRGPQGELSVGFHTLPPIARDQIILPAGLLERVERQTVRFAQLRNQLLAAGRHLKRGLLLYGPPGTGKTLTAMYLSSQMRDRTVLLLAGPELGLLRPACAMARALQPATVVLEDVDLIAEERTHPGGQCNTLLYELLNQMDGLHDDADVLFLLTTNRPDMIEPALASRPGRIDLAIEVPLPDAEGRLRLLELYGRGLTLRVSSWDQVVQQTEGASAAFMRELMRRATLLAVDETSEPIIEDRHLAGALHDLVFDGGPLTRSLLGARLQITGSPSHKGRSE